MNPRAFAAEALRDEHDIRVLALQFAAEQPRAPKGRPTGGQWVKGNKAAEAANTPDGHRAAAAHHREWAKKFEGNEREGHLDAASQHEGALNATGELAKLKGAVARGYSKDAGGLSAIEDEKAAPKKVLSEAEELAQDAADAAKSKALRAQWAKDDAEHAEKMAKQKAEDAKMAPVYAKQKKEREDREKLHKALLLDMKKYKITTDAQLNKLPKSHPMRVKYPNSFYRGGRK